MHLVRDPLPSAEGRSGLSPKIAIVGVGNPLRGDDAAGGLALAALQRMIDEPEIAWLLIEQPLDLVDSLMGYEAAFVVDACMCSLPSGQMIAFSWPANEIQDYRSPSTHTMSLSQSLALAETLGFLPKTVRIVAVSGKEFRTGQPPSGQVAAGADAAARWIAEEVRPWLAK